MAGKGVNVKLYVELYKRCPKDQIRLLRKVESKHKTYIDKINTLPEKLPKIDFEFYKDKVRPDFVNMVTEFESKYNGFEVPVPQETASDEIEKEREEVQNMVDKFKDEKCERIGELEARIDEIKSLIPYEQMTWEEYMNSYPESAPDFINKPTFWPHFPDEQEIGAPKGATSDH